MTGNDWSILILAIGLLANGLAARMILRRVKNLEQEVRNLHIYNVKGPLHHERTSPRP